MVRVEPIPETVEAVRELSLWGGDEDLLPGLVRLADSAVGVVPDLVGVSLSRLADELTFTVVASNEEVAVLDALQYVDTGPCVEGAYTGLVTDTGDQGVLDEDRWRLFAQVSAANAVRSTLTLPLFMEGHSTGTVNLYAASARAFVGHHQALADIFGGWAEAAVTNADLAFDTRTYARATPDRIRELTLINGAIGLLAAQLDVDIDQAGERLFDAAARAGVGAGELARFLIGRHEEQEDGAAEGLA